ncbi:MAPEG family protein [Limimaricola hongkongensis]|uniref:Inner membrane protein n=1 Tax=Limimaricola hongkongensis DSM 17492 TaxID=1122180 RepID=A0A017HA54_9RHOB|nr:MAPEG family protein [Limimaricola hongkongensis]EYD70649.1 inner membrane protein [Limimaricola hongkongensis DSM 17492]
MSSELDILALYGLLVLVLIVVQVLFAMSQVGLPRLAQPRDDMPRLTGVAGRMERCVANSVTAMALFAPAVLILAAREGFGGGTLLAAQVFLFARAAYALLYPAGIPWARTGVWGLGFFATLYLYIAAL